LAAAGLLRLWSTGYVEPAIPPVLPAHLIAQQLLALTLQESDSGLGRAHWQEWLGEPPVFGQDAMAYADVLTKHLATEGWLHDDQGILSPGQTAEKTIGKRNFLELTSVFVAAPLVSVRQGRVEIGQVPDLAISAAFADKGGPAAVLLAGRAWKINSIDWKRRVAQVEPVNDKGAIRFSGTSQPLGYDLCQAMAEVLDGKSLEPVELTRRAIDALEDVRDELPKAGAGRTLLVQTKSGLRWYTFAGLRANLELAARLVALRSQTTQRNNLYIALDPGVDREAISAALAEPARPEELLELVESISGALKLERALPENLVAEIMTKRLSDPSAVQRVIEAPIDAVFS